MCDKHVQFEICNIFYLKTKSYFKMLHSSGTCHKWTSLHSLDFSLRVFNVFWNNVQVYNCESQHSRPLQKLCLHKHVQEKKGTMPLIYESRCLYSSAHTIYQAKDKQRKMHTFEFFSETGIASILCIINY